MRSALGATALSTVFLLAACGGDPEPRFGPEPSAEPTVVSSSSAPAEPEAWEEKTPEGAVAFAKHWTATFSEAFQTGQTDDLAALSTRGCGGCEFFVSLIREVYDGGGSIDGASWQFVNAGWSAPNGDESLVAVTGTMRIPAQTIRRNDEPPAEASPISERYIFTVAWQDGGWQTQDLVREG